MSFSLFRLARTVRSSCASLTAIIGFSFLLTFVFILYQPTHGPGLSQRLGWQSWDTVSSGNGPQRPTQNDPNVETSNPTTTPSNPTPNPPPDGTDWWNVNTEQEQVDTTSFPLDKWSPLLPHDTGLSEIAITRCMFDPAKAGDLCAPQSTSEDNAIRGKWVRIERDMNIQNGMWYLNIWYRRTRRQDINLIDALTLLPGKQEPESGDNWHKVPLSTRDGIPRTEPLFLWYHLGKTFGEMTAEEKQNNLITELDVLFGESVPWYGFEKMETAITPEQEGRVQSVWIAYRKGVKIAPKAPPLHFSKEGNFKILQIADLHFSIAFGKCRDTALSPCKHSDELTSDLITRILDEEKPDLVIFTGDQLNGQSSSWDPMSVIAKFSQMVTKRKIPWAAVFGNHDEEDGGKYQRKDEQLKMMQSLPYSLVQAGPKDIHGVGNYVLKVKSADPSMTHLLTLYFLDSGSYSAGVLDWFGFWRPTEYDYLHQDQIDWFIQESSTIKPIERPFKPDGAKDLPGVWKRQEGQVLPDTSKLAKPNAMMFFHIPLPEAYGEADVDSKTSKALDVGISGLEAPGAAKKNEGFFEKGVLQVPESAHVNEGGKPEVKVIANGHCHVTENCKRVKGVWMCFGGGGSYSGYGKVGFDRRFRIYDISNYGEKIRTYKKTEKGETVDDMILSGPGAPPLR